VFSVEFLVVDSLRDGDFEMGPLFQNQRSWFSGMTQWAWPSLLGGVNF
jgi:hypothetical protein